MKNIYYMAAKSCRDDKTKWLPFPVHSEDTAGIAVLLFQKWLSEAARNYISRSLITCSDREQNEIAACNFCKFISLTHDIGKLTPAFQSKISPNIENHTDLLSSNGFNLSMLTHTAQSPHNVAGQYILESRFGIPEEISIIVGAHHGGCSYDVSEQEGFPSNYYGYKNADKEKWNKLRSQWLEYALAKSGFSDVKSLPIPDVKVQMILTGLLIMSDWIASNTDYFPYIDIDCTVDEEMLHARVKNAWKRLSLTESWYAEKAADNRRFFESRFSFEPNSVQTAFMNAVNGNTAPGIYILEAPMGIGKTEAALSAAEILAAKFGYGGMFFGLPTQATANGIFDRILKWSEGCDDEQHSIRLAHGMTDLNDEYREIFHGKADDSADSIIVHEWFEGRKQALLSDFVVATVDQFLLASLMQKHVMLRHLGLIGKVVIIDECHAYDAYMNVYLDRTLKWMSAYKVPVIILSATLPPQRRIELIKAYMGSEPDFDAKKLAYPVLTWTSGSCIKQEEIVSDSAAKKITVTHIDESDIVNRLEAKLSDGGCAAVIVNSVLYAQRLTELIKAEMPKYRVICFHSRFISTDRAETEKLLMALVGKKSNELQRDRLIVVGTQVLEQSLDVDFDYMITELCPMDLLLQRSGRLHRHKRTRPLPLQNAELSVLKPSDSGIKSVYSPWILSRTAQSLPSELDIPSCIPTLVSKVYSEPDDAEALSDEYIEFCNQIKTKKQKASKYCIKSNKLNSSRNNTIADFLDVGEANNDSDAEAAVRDTEDTIEVLVLVKESEINYTTFSRKVTFDITSSLSDREAEKIAKERLRLPIYFSKYRYRETLKALQAMPERWRDSKWLKGELLLLLDGDNQAEISEKILRYSSERGLEIFNKEQE